MVQDPRKQQKKLERRKAKEKAQRRELVRRESGGMPARLSAAAAHPSSTAPGWKGSGCPASGTCSSAANSAAERWRSPAFSSMSGAWA